MDIMGTFEANAKCNNMNQMHHFNVGIYASRNVCVKDIDSRASMVLQNYQKFIEMTSNMIYIVALGVGFKCPLKIHLNTQCPMENSEATWKKATKCNKCTLY